MPSVDDLLDHLIERIAERVVELLPQPATPPEAPVQQPEYLTTKQAAKALAMGTSTLELWRSKGTGPRWVKIGTAVRYSRADLNAWIAAHAKKK